MTDNLVSLDQAKRNAAKSVRGAKGPKRDPEATLVTEDSAALEFVGMHRRELRFCHDAGSWYRFDGNVWKKNRTGLAFNWARELARKLAEREPDRVRYVSSKTSFAAGVERYASRDPALAVTGEFWNRDLYMLGTPSGVVDLKTGKLKPARPEDGISKSTAVAPSDLPTCPMWEQFLLETTGGDLAVIRFLQQFVGYSLTGDVSEHTLLFGHGGGGNGKSVFINTVSGILGEYATVAAMETFTASQGDRHPTDLAMLQGARLVTASETEEGRAWAESRIKQITGGDKISARYMRQDFFTFQPQFKLLVIGNHKPVLKNVDDAARRRFCIVPFTRKPLRPDPNLEQRLRKEWPAILRWAIDGCLDWQTNKLVRPESVVSATKAYFGAQDIVGQFLEDRCQCDVGNPHRWAFSGEVFSEWATYAKAAGETIGSQKALSETLQARGFELGRTAKGRTIRGLSITMGHDG